ncbi:MAG: glycosyltransferase [Bryobacterales bacterium]|nr:glycosyltransferase [Bryobacteraceae bacterium]MDW8355182.1 glycosyltransferase [Bryobacterales bacterium]
MNILLVHSTVDLYGASRALLRLAVRLRRDRHQVTVVLPGRGPLNEELARADVRTECLPELVYVDRGWLSAGQMVAKLSRLPSSVLALTRLIRGYRAELVHTNTALILSSPLASRVCRVPHVWHIRELFTEFPRLWEVHGRLMTVLADRVVAVSRAVASQFKRYSLRGKVLAIHDGCPAAEFQAPLPSRISGFRRSYGGTATVLVGLPGRIKLRRKGQEVFVEAAAKLRERHPAARFLIVGSPFPGNEQHYQEVVRRIQQRRLEGHVVLAGEVREMPVVYAALDVVALCSVLPEPFANIVIEAMAMSKPVVGTATGGTPEQIVDGVTGFLVRPGDAEDLAQALDRLLADAALRRRMGAAGRQRFLEEFEFEAFYRRMLAVYSDVLDHSADVPASAYAESLR